MELFVPKNYPLNLPWVKDVDDVITYDHKFSNGNLCVSTVFDLQLKLKDSKCISDYIDGFLIPYFISYEYWKENHKDIFGDRDHSIAGVFQSIQEFLGVPRDNFSLFETLICWASRSKKFKRFIPLASQSFYIRKYSRKIGILRQLGILRIKAIYKLIEICKRNPAEKISNSLEIKRLFDLACS